MKKTFLTLTLVACLRPVALLHATAPQYFVAASLPVEFSGTTLTGKIQILKDLRLKGGKRPPFAIDGPSEVKFRNAMLRLVSASGEKLDVKTLERPSARLKISKVDGPGAVYEVTVDYSTGFGTYNGPTTFFVCATDGKLSWMEATDAKTGKREKMAFLTSMRTHWKVKNPRTILYAFAHPNSKGTGGEVFMERVSYEDGAWVRHSVTKPGPPDFESEDTVPKDTEFP